FFFLILPLTPSSTLFPYTTLFRSWLPNPCICLYPLGIPRSLITIVTWWSDSGSNVQKSQLLLGLLKLVFGSRLTAWFRSGNFIGSRKKKTGVLFPTKSQIPSSV